MARLYIAASLAELTQLVQENLHRKQVLGDVRAELSFRTTSGARQLEREVAAIIEGRVPLPPKPPRPDRPDDQGELL
jgi:hypothetical protein